MVRTAAQARQASIMRVSKSIRRTDVNEAFDSASLFAWWLPPVIAILTYVNTLTYEWNFDDRLHITDNPDTDSSRTPLSRLFLHDNWGWNITHVRTNTQYRPLSVLSMRLNHMVAGGHHPHQFHLTNVLLFALCVYVYHRFCTAVVKVPQSTATVAALLFAVHPVHVECVTNVTGRSEVLMFTLHLAALLIWRREFDSQLLRRSTGGSAGSLLQSSTRFVAYILTVVAGVLVKETALMTIPVAVAADYCLAPHEAAAAGASTSSGPTTQEAGGADAASAPAQALARKGSGGRKDGTDGEREEREPPACDPAAQAPKAEEAEEGGVTVAWHVVGVAVAALGLGLRAAMVPRWGPDIRHLDNPVAHLPWGASKLLTLTYLHSQYLFMLLLPIRLCCDYSFNAIPILESSADPRVLHAAVAYAAFGGLLCWAAASAEHQVLFLGLWGGLMFAPAAGVAFDVGSVFAERFLFAPSGAFCLLGALALQRVRPPAALARPAHRHSLALLLVFAYALRTTSHNPVWSTSMALWQATYAAQPNNAKAAFNLGISIMNAASPAGSKDTEVLTLFDRALEIKPDYDNVYIERAKIFRRHGLQAEMVRDFERAAEISGHPEAHFNLGLAHMTAGKEHCQVAEQHYLKAIEKEPYDHRSHTNIGICKHWHGLLQEASQWLGKALAMTPMAEAGIPADALANVWRDFGDTQQALELHALALRLDPTSFAFRFNQALTHELAGRYADAASDFEIAATLEPDETKKKYILGKAAEARAASS